MSLKAYLAASYPRRSELERHARDLAGLGIEVVSTWVFKSERDEIDDGTNIIGGPLDQQLWAAENLLDVMTSDVLIAFSEPPGTLSRGNRHVEFGMALGAGKLMVVVGPREMVFHYHVGVYQYDTWEEALPALERLAHAVVR